MKRVWAPWRIHYILGRKSKKCIFCLKKTPGYRKKRFILAERTHAYVMLNRYPYTNGHLMVVPYRHIADLEGLRPDEIAEFFMLVRYACSALKKAIKPDGLNIGANLGRTAGAGEEDHFHFHIVARWDGDHNFLPVIGGTMAMPQYLEETYARLLPHFHSDNV